MKKRIVSVLAVLVLICLTLAACAEDTQSESQSPYSPEPASRETETPSEDDEALYGLVSQAVSESSFTIEQLQRAMYPQWNFGGEPDVLDHQIISAQQVERESDYVWFEPAGEYVDASNAVRYRMEVRHKDFRIEWHDLGNSQVYPEEIIGDYIVSVMYNYFVVENGEPELLFVVC